MNEITQLKKTIRTYIEQNPGASVMQIRRAPQVKQITGGAGISRTVDSMIGDGGLYYHPKDPGKRHGGKIYFVRPDGWSCDKCAKSAGRNPSRNDVSICTYCERGSSHRVKAAERAQKECIETLWNNTMMGKWLTRAIVSHSPYVPPSRYAL